MSNQYPDWKLPPVPPLGQWAGLGGRNPLAIVVALPLLAMLAAFAVHVLGGGQHAANGSLLVTFGREYINPEGGDGSFNLWRHEVVMNAELEILNRTETKKMVLDRVGPARILDEAAPPAAPGVFKWPWRNVTAYDRALANLEANLTFSAVRNSNVIHLRYVHPDRQVAQDVLNKAIEVYLDSRKEIFSPAQLTPIAQLLEDYEQEWNTAKRLLGEFKSVNRLTNIDAEIADMQARTAELEKEAIRYELALTEAASKQANGGTALQLGAAKSGELDLSVKTLQSTLAAIDKRRNEFRTKLVQLDQNRDQLERLTENVTLARRRFEKIQSSLDDSRMKSSLSKAGWSNIRIIQPPYVPMLQKGPSLAQKVSIAGLIGCLAGLGLVLGLRFWRESGLLDLLRPLLGRVNARVQPT